MDLDAVYNGDSVRRTIRRLYSGHPDTPVTLPHATVPPITPSLVREHADIFDAVVASVREQLRSEQQQQQSATTAATAPSNATVAGHWLLSVPPSMRQSEAEVVNYLGMLVAIDFCHWAEVPPCSADTVQKGEAAGLALTEEGGIVALPGEEVKGFAGFYTVVLDDAPPSTTGRPKSTGKPAELLTEPKDTAESQPDSTEGTAGGASTKREVTLLRGSAAMMLLLRCAVEVHGIPWHDVSYLRSFHGDVEAALQAMRVCFMGCEKDGVTPLWMPCTRRRVQLLLSLADAFAQQRTSFYQLLRESAGYMFRPPANTAAARAGVCGFVPSLVRFHPRYHDFAREGGGSGDVTSTADAQSLPVPILKLSQLTALALEQALPPLWRSRSATTPSVSTSSSSSSSWLSERAALVAGSHDAGFFLDRAELSICCDYQIPKTLRAAGLLLYDDRLAQVVDHHVLLEPGSAEEASIRIATLVAADRLQEYLNARGGHAFLPRDDVPGAEQPSAQCSVNHLDYALWYIGRYMVPSEARHHLCRTIMY